MRTCGGGAADDYTCSAEIKISDEALDERVAGESQTGCASVSRLGVQVLGGRVHFAETRVPAQDCTIGRRVGCTCLV